jgi:hypothetical protein
LELPAGPGGKAILATSRDQGGSVPLLTLVSLIGVLEARSQKHHPDIYVKCHDLTEEAIEGCFEEKERAFASIPPS